MIEKVVEAWHQVTRGEYPGGWDALLADDVVFHSPVVFTPQKGKAITKLYLGAAGSVFGGADSAKKSGEPVFSYRREILSGDSAMLEFEMTLDGKYVNGVDIIRCNAEGKITEIKVMIRPLQAVNLLHQKMKLMLESMQPAE